MSGMCNVALVKYLYRLNCKGSKFEVMSGFEPGEC